MASKQGRGRGVWLRPEIRDVAGSLERWSFLSQLSYWQKHTRIVRDDRKWVALKLAEWREQTLLSEWRLRKVIEELKEERVIESCRHKLGGTPRLFLRIIGTSPLGVALKLDPEELSGSPIRVREEEKRVFSSNSEENSGKSQVSEGEEDCSQGTPMTLEELHAAWEED